jgi:hypothetical protein
MMDLALDKNDLALRNGDLSLCTNDTDAITQTISIRLKSLAGECFMDSQLCIPYLTEIFGKKRNDRFLRHMIVSEIENVPGIREITNFRVEEKTDRGITIIFNVVLNNQSIISIKESVEI